MKLDRSTAYVLLVTFDIPYDRATAWRNFLLKKVQEGKLLDAWRMATNLDSLPHSEGRLGAAVVLQGASRQAQYMTIVGQIEKEFLALPIGG